MLSAKRVIIATICGIIFGFVCWLMATSDPEGAEEMTWGIQLSIILSRTLLGFMIGISALKIQWWAHGIILGFIASIPMAVTIVDDIQILIGTLVMGIIYGFLTELITSVLFNARPVAYVKKESS